MTGLPCLPAMVMSLAVFWLSVNCENARAAEPVATASGAAEMETNATPGYNVQTYVVQGKPLLTPDLLASLFSKYTGTNVSLQEIMHAASDLETEYRHEGYPLMNIAIAPKRIANGIVTLNAFPGAVAQIVVAGRCYLVGSKLAANPPMVASGGQPNSAVAASATTNQIPVLHQLNRPATPEEMARAYAALAEEMSDISARERDTRIHVVSTNTGPRFAVENYQVEGNTLLSPATMAMVLTNIDGAYGTNVTLTGIRRAATELLAAYRARGYVTVDVTLPPQKLTNATVKIHVTEGRLVAIDVKGNHSYYFSSNNVMRALPSLHTNMILNGQIFQAELNRANADQDRQISPVLEPGPDPGTSLLTLNVQDRLPFHAKMDLDNQNSPGTPILRLNTSAIYDNLWQEENSLGVQYGFSPEEYKTGKQWNFYDLPQVANYSAFYRMPLGNPSSMEDALESSPGSFGYDEATHKFNLPPASGQPELNFFASRSTIDTGVTTGPLKTLFTTKTTNEDDTVVTNSQLRTLEPQQDITINNDVGGRLTIPLPASSDFHSSLSAGVDYKTYQVASSATNIFYLGVIETAYNTPPVTIPVTSTNYSPVPYTVKYLKYLPVSLHYDGGWRDALGVASFGLGLSANLWFSSVTTIGDSPTNTSYTRGVKSLQQITGSKESTGHWIILNPSFSHTFQIVTNWVTTIRADGQWSSEPLISNEQFGAGGVNSVRGYHEGEVFGDTGWHASLEQETPPFVVGTVYGHTPLTLRGTAYMDFADTFLLDPQGRPSHTALWSVGIGGVASIGSHWQARLLLSIPLLNSPTVNAYEPYFNFMLTGQF